MGILIIITIYEVDSKINISTEGCIPIMIINQTNNTIHMYHSMLTL